MKRPIACVIIGTVIAQGRLVPENNLIFATVEIAPGVFRRGRLIHSKRTNA